MDANVTCVSSAVYKVLVPIESGRLLGTRTAREAVWNSDDYD